MTGQKSIDIKVVIAVLTHNRRELFKQTISSLKQTKLPYERVILDNGSTDGTEKLVATLPNSRCNRDGDYSIGHGFRLAVEMALERDPDLIVFTADDYIYCPGWLDHLVAFWQFAPPKTALCSCVVEPIYHWNTIERAERINGKWALRRRTLPGANWSFPVDLWPEIEPMVPSRSHKYDHRVCHALRNAGWGLYALPLAEHAGAGRSAWRRP